MNIIEGKKRDTKEIKKQFNRKYQQRFGVVAGYLPQDAKHISKWLSTQVETALKEKEELGDKYLLEPSVLQFKNYLDQNLVLKQQVELMIHEGWKVHEKYATPKSPPYYIKNLDFLYIVLNSVITKAPLFDSLSRPAFPMSATFVYMMFTEAGWDVFRDVGFNDQLRNMLKAWCDFLDSRQSVLVVNTGEHGWLSPASVIANDLNEFVTEAEKRADPAHWGFKSYNGFFHRNIIPSFRPIDGVGNRAVVVSANDGTVNRLARNVKRETDFDLKSQPYSLVNMLDHSPHVDRFVGGDVLQTFLSGNNYHRWHAPISGTIKEMRIVPAFMFSELLSEGFDPSAGTLSQEYEANVNTRALIFIESDDPLIGMVCVIPIGITEISSIKFDDKIAVNQRVTKGQLLGRFSYGGSSLALVFQPGAIKQFNVTNPVKPSDGQKVKVNAQIAIANTTIAS